jgi:hypothetical protein
MCCSACEFFVRVEQLPFSGDIEENIFMCNRLTNSNCQKEKTMKYSQLGQHAYARVGVILAILLAILIGLTTGADFAQAQNGGPKWSTNAMACVPNGSTTNANMVQTSHAHARYTDGKTGDLYLICPFSDASLHGAAVSTIEMTYISTGSGKVSAVLRQVKKGSGDVTNILEVRTEPRCLTDSSHLGDRFAHCRDFSSGHVLDFNNNYYYVQISLNRQNSSDDVRIEGVSLW